MKSPVRVAVTGAAGQIGYALLFHIAAGDMFCAWVRGVLATQNIVPRARVAKTTSIAFAIRRAKCPPLETMSNFFIKRSPSGN